MKTAFKWFDFSLNVLLVSVFVSVVIFFYFGSNFYGENFTSTLQYQIKTTLFTFVVLASLFFGILYLVIGAILWIVNRKKGNVSQVSFAKKIFVKGVVRSVLSYVLLFFLSLAMSFFQLTLSDSPLPKIINEKITKGFPIQDLEIMHLRIWYNHNSDNAWSCDVIVRNNNPKLIAINLFFKNATEKNNDDQINPGESKVISIYPDNDSQTPCNDVSITSAEIIKYSSN